MPSTVVSIDLDDGGFGEWNNGKMFRKDVQAVQQAIEQNNNRTLNNNTQSTSTSPHPPPASPSTTIGPSGTSSNRRVLQIGTSEPVLAPRSVPYERQRNGNEQQRNTTDKTGRHPTRWRLYFKFLIFLVTLGVICLTYYFKIHKYNPEPVICKTPDCVMSAGEILKNLDQSIDPCWDFEEFACGGWRDHNLVDTGMITKNNFAVVHDRMFHQIKKIMASPINTWDPRAIKEIKTFYKACNNNTAWKEQGVKPILERIEQMGGFPMINSSWTAENYDLLGNLAEARRSHIMNYILGVNVDYDAKDTSQYAIYVDLGILPTPASIVTKKNDFFRTFHTNRLIVIFKLMFKAFVLKMKQKIENNLSENQSETFLVEPLDPSTANDTDLNSRLSYNISKILNFTDDSTLQLLMSQSKQDSKMHLVESNLGLDEGVAPNESNLKFLTQPLDSEILKQLSQFDVPERHIEQDIDGLLDFILALAELEISTTEDATRYTQYNPMTIRELQELADFSGADGFKINWLEYINSVFVNTGIKFDENQRVIVKNVGYIKKIPVLIQKTPYRTIANFISYLLFMNLESQISDTTSNFISPIEQNILNIGRRQERPWLDCSQTAEKMLSGVVSYIFVKKIFKNETIQPAKEMVTGVHSSFKNLLSGIRYWMDGPTKKAGLEKVDNMVHLVGYDQAAVDSKLLDEKYADLPNLQSDDHIGNLLKIARHFVNGYLTKINDKSDRNKFVMAPFTPNAAYGMSQNSMVIPAGILQAPFFRHDTLAALNYGSLGSIIGHEITHGFDNQGRFLDKSGNLRQWWSNSSLNSFVNKAVCLLQQYEKFPRPSDLNQEERNVISDSQKLDGLSTLSENIADNGGIRASHEAFKDHLTRNEHERDMRLPGLEKYSPEQLFFISFAQTWCASYTPDGLKSALQGKEHSPGPFRIKGVYENYRPMRNAFKCYGRQWEKGCKLW